MELGIYTFVERSAAVPAEQRMRELMAEIELADQVGLDVFGVGEHHRPDYLVSAPAVVLSAASQRTKRIRLTSAVSVLSSDDPVRVFQEFSTVDLLSGGRAEIMAGRGTFIKSICSSAARGTLLTRSFFSTASSITIGSYCRAAA
ncbi:MAG: LLM class flavin-dependent oxidoreductase [Acidobacteria bacterium]|nr:LLM class flavin-dependent oxidoreductase [Acidobacteriota bacterium]